MSEIVTVRHARMRDHLPIVRQDHSDTVFSVKISVPAWALSAGSSVGLEAAVWLDESWPQSWVCRAGPWFRLRWRVGCR